MDLILDFRKLNKSSLPLVGGKNASLGEMINADIRVPPGFAVTTDSYAVFMDKAGINDTIFSLLADLDPDDIDALNQAAEKVQDMIKTAVIPDDVQKASATGILCCAKNAKLMAFRWRLDPAQPRKICPQPALPGSRTPTSG